MFTRDWGLDQRRKRPVRLLIMDVAGQSIGPCWTGVDPAAEHIYFRGVETWLTALFRRHEHFFILAADIADERTGRGLMRHDGGLAAVAATDCPVAHIQTV